MVIAEQNFCSDLRVDVCLGKYFSRIEYSSISLDLNVMSCIYETDFGEKLTGQMKAKNRKMLSCLPYLNLPLGRALVL